MLHWSPNMYLDADLAPKKKRYQKLLEKKKLIRPLYCITLPVNGQNIMEIYSSAELWFRWYQERELTVIGLAGSKEKAEMLAAQICLDMICREDDISPEIVHCYFENPDMRDHDHTL